MNIQTIRTLLDRIADLESSADDTGCTEDLTVASASALQAVVEIADALRATLTTTSPGDVPAQQAESNAPRAQQLYLYSGRVSGDDEDSVYLIAAPSQGTAEWAFKCQLREEEGADTSEWTDADEERCEQEGQEIFINASQLVGLQIGNNDFSLNESMLVRVSEGA